MIKFNSKTMEKRIVKSGFVVACERFTLVFDDDEVNAGECVDAYVGDEVWIFTSEHCDKGKYGDGVFCYFPKIGYATTVLRKYLS
ncbi:hypothetical protein NVP1135O_14 [Vibrio phage 1.135.O._10N.222.54.B6]|nr:hypothetical protein NVP1135O_14 [Vibrio phage 1.135.O._10N.222.54.B6]